MTEYDQLKSLSDRRWKSLTPTITVVICFSETPGVFEVVGVFTSRYRARKHCGEFISVGYGYDCNCGHFRHGHRMDTVGLNEVYKYD